jgi:mannose-6-phosphate isomerase-like protein (cupin superfamily)
MSNANIEPFDLLTTYVNIQAGPTMQPMVGGDDFWSKLGQYRELDDGLLLTVLHNDKDWPNWERHPNGDELVLVLSGEFKFILETSDKEQIVELSAGKAYIVPQGVWHRALVITPGDILHLTRGAGTEGRLA